MHSISSRKRDHLTLCATSDVAFRSRTTLLEEVQLIHDALPDLRAGDIDTSCAMLGHRLRAPFVIAAMTGGTDEARTVNRTLASIAEERGYAFALGSQRAMHREKSAFRTYEVRDVAPNIPVFGNLGVVQARRMTTADVEALIHLVKADALCIHLNPAMEMVQSGGDRDFAGGLTTIERLTRELSVPVIVKETGCGLSSNVGRRVYEAGVRHVDVSGAGGTSWVGVEAVRAESAGDMSAHALGEAFWDWGIPTAASVVMMAPIGFSSIIATGGISSGLDAARAIALGATAAGIARPVLQALRVAGREGVRLFFDRCERELRAAMLLTGSRDLAALRRAPKLIGNELTRWMSIVR